MENKIKFSEWFFNKLSVERYPLPGELIKNSKQIDYVINVSDEYIEANHNICNENNIKYFWFPLSECTSMGINSIYGVLQILWLAESQNKKVLLHCHAGSNRSVTVAECYYYMRTKTYLVRKDNPKLNKDILNMFIFDSEEEKIETEKSFKNSRIETNQHSNVLPPKYLLETFLKKCEKSFENYSIANGGFLDKLKLESKIYN